jgi:hypothetical protein
MMTKCQLSELRAAVNRLHWLLAANEQGFTWWRALRREIARFRSLTTYGEAEGKGAQGY